MGMAIDNTFGDQNEDFAAINEKLARRRKLAEQLVANAMQDNGGAGYHGGRIYAVGNQLGNVAQIIGGTLMGRMADNDQQDLYTRQRQAEQDTLASIPSEGPERTQAQLKAFQQMPSLRDTLKAQMGIDEQERNRIERGEQAAADRVEKEANAQAQREFLAAQGDLNRQNKVDLRQMPATVVHVGNGSRGGVKAPAGYRYNEDGTALEPIPGGPADKAAKPVNLTAAQQKAVDDSDALLGHIDNALEMVKSNPNAVGFKTIMPDMALSKIDPEGVQARAAVGGLSAERVHQLSGAAVSPAEFARLRPYLPASGDTADAVEKKLTSLKGEVERIRQSHMKGPTRAQPQQPTNERKTIGGVTYEKRGGQWFAL